MDIPDGFDAWSDECKRAFEELKAEWDAREEARRASESAEREARSAEAAKEAAEQARDAAQAESTTNQAWLDGYRAAREAKQREVDARKARRARELEALNADLNRRLQNGEITVREGRAEFRAAKEAHDAEVEALEQEYDDLAAERRRLRRRQRELRDELRRLEREADAAKDRAEEARERAEEALDAFEDKRSTDKIVEDYFALIRRCGPQDPQPGGESIEVPLEEPPSEGGDAEDSDDDGDDDNADDDADDDTDDDTDDDDEEDEDDEDELTPWQEAVLDYIRGLVPWFGYLFPSDPPAFVGVGSDTLPASYLPDEQRTPEQQQAKDPRQEMITEFPIDDPPAGPKWKEGCIEFMWVEGTRPEVDPRLTSNPITRTVALAMADVNAIWGSCECVRFTARVRVVTQAQLGNVWSEDDGISVVDGRTRSVSKDDIRDDYGRTVRGLLENQECTAFLVVDGVAGGAGFATLGGKVGVVEIASVPGQQGYGDTTAHELGHAVGNIDHVVDEGTANERKHEHGELMWGEGCEGHPDKQRMRYDKLTERDCAAMKEALKDTEDPCGGEPL